jgi:hypothetical protein
MTQVYLQNEIFKDIETYRLLRQNYKGYDGVDNYDDDFNNGMEHSYNWEMTDEESIESMEFAAAFWSGVTQNDYKKLMKDLFINHKVVNRKYCFISETVGNDDEMELIKILVRTKKNE